MKIYQAYNKMSFPLSNEEGEFVCRVEFFETNNQLTTRDKELICLLDMNDPNEKYYRCVFSDEELEEGKRPRRKEK